jgi:hypothetical protein
MSIIEIINQIEADKRKRKVAPTHALYLEVVSKASEYYPICVKEIVTAELEELVKQNIITIGDTINDKYITVL